MGDVSSKVSGATRMILHNPDNINSSRRRHQSGKLLERIVIRGLRSCSIPSGLFGGEASEKELLEVVVK